MRCRNTRGHFFEIARPAFVPTSRTRVGAYGRSVMHIREARPGLHRPRRLPTATRPSGPCSQALAAEGRGPIPAAPSSPRPPWTVHSPGGASRSSATSRGGRRRPSPSRPPGPLRLPRPHGPSRARRPDEIASSRAVGQLERLRRLRETHRDRKVVGGGAIPLAPTSLTHFHVPSCRRFRCLGCPGPDGENEDARPGAR